MEIVNIVCSGNLNAEIDLNKIKESEKENFIYNPSKYHGGYVILSCGKATLYKSGKYIIVGLKSQDDVKKAFLELKNFLSKFVDLSNAEEPKIRNMVVLDDLNANLDLTKVSLYLGLENVEYEPEQFPGLVYRAENLTILIFSSGKIVVLGGKDINEMKNKYAEVRQLILNFITP